MGRPKNKTELLSLGEENYQKLLSYIDELPEDSVQKEFPENYLNRNIRDVLAHLYHWHTLVRGWIDVGMQGKKPDIPAKGYTWKTTPDLNKSIQEQYSIISIEKARALLNASHNEMRSMINSYSNEELFEKKRHKWTGTTSLAAYLISCTSSHYDWAFKLIRKCLKTSK